MPAPAALEASISHGLAFLERQQEPDGSFVSYSSARTRPFRRIRSWQTTFVPALMLASLAGLEDPAARRVRDGLAAFLLRQKDDNWAFNYWARTAPEYRTMPYPNDLDDTFCALASLYLHDPSLVDETVLARAVKLLLATETAVGGPYRTWLVPPDSEAAWLDVDPAVNSNVAYFLSLVSNRLPELERLMGQAIVDDSFSSPYYPSVYAFVYYFARAYAGPERPRLLRKARRLHRTAPAALDQALCLNARLRLGETQDLAAAVKRLLLEQRRDGSWPAAAFYADPVRDGKPYYNGGAALSTAFVLEALQLYRQSEPPAKEIPGRIRHDGGQQSAAAPVLALAKRQCRTLPAELRRTMLRSLAAVARSGNGAEITGLPGDFARSLRRPFHPPQDSFLEQLGLANLYGWLAYSIYDDFIDEEGRPDLLPAANAAMRRSLRGFLEALPADTSFQELVREIFDTVDDANAWELAHCRFKRQDSTVTVGKLPDYGDRARLAERSLGHTLGPLAILSASGNGGAATRYTRRALEQYLIARQLNDDLHDWQEDLAAGRVTYVVSRMLAGLRPRPGDHSVAELIAGDSTQFWYRTLPAVCRDMRGHIGRGRRALEQAGIFTDTNVLGALFDGLEASVEETLATRGQAGNFLRHYLRKTVKL